LPFTAAESGKRFKLEYALQFGLLPLIHSSQNSGDTLRAYAGLYLKEEVQAEGIVRNIGDFARFLEILSLKIAEGYLNILQDLLLCHLVPVFTKCAKRRIVSHPKFYYFDIGIFRSLRSQGPLDTATEVFGHTLEGLVLQHLQAWNDYSDLDYKIYYWRTTSGVEVDFVLYGPNGLWTIEVKNNKNVSTKEVRGLCVFGEDYPEAELLLLYRGTQKMKIKNVLCMPVEDFLQGLPS
jgi:predicted AAA+ superfamily ATPase